MASHGQGEETNLSEECLAATCTICRRKGQVKQAHRYCKDCKKNLCNDCLQLHDDFNEGHNLIDGQDDDSLQPALTTKCMKHADKVLEMFCEEHDELLCSACVLLDHRNCEDLKRITDSIEQLTKDPLIQHVPEKLRCTLENVDQLITTLDRHVEVLSQSEVNFLQEIEEYVKRIMSKIETLKVNARKEVTTQHEQLASEAIEKRQVCADMKTDISKSLDDMKSSDNNKAHVFIMMKRAQGMMRKVDTLCRESENLIKTKQFAFKPDWSVEDYLNEVKSLVALGPYEASMKSEIDAKIEYDLDSCDIEGCCVLPDGTVLLVDDNNKRLKQVDPSVTSVREVCGIQGCIRGISSIDPTEVVVCRVTGDIQIISLGTKVAGKRTVKLNHPCYRIAYDNKELFVSDLDVVYTHDLNGTVLRTISMNESGEKLFSDITGIYLDREGNRVYVADLHNGLICTTRTGQVMFVCSNKQLGVSGAFGVCGDKKGNVLVCGYHSNNVVQVTEDGRVIGEILSKADGLEKPKCFCYDSYKRRLYVGGKTSQFLMFGLI